jgi:hypothetical protein
LDHLRAGTSPISVQAGWCNGKTLTNINAGGDFEWDLPAAAVGMHIRFARIETSGRLRIDPSGTEVVRGGGAGKYIFTDTTGGTIYLRCYSAGTWDIDAQIGTWAFEP